jgi:hypothetical protein
MVDASGGNSSFAVTTLPECAWTVTTSANWISGLSPASGQGNGNVSFRIAANDGSSIREGMIVVNDEQVRVSQRAPCRYGLTPASQTIATSGGSSTLTLSTDAECGWTASTDTNWISLTPPTSGTGGSVVAFTVPPNTGSERTGTITVAGQRATVLQPGAAQPPTNCNVQISPSNQNVPAGGGTGTIAVATTPNTCAWAAQSSVPWITITSGSSGSGDGAVTFTVAANAGAARTGSISIANRTFTVSQAAAAAPPPACTYVIAPNSQNAPAAASTGSVTVTSGANCTWTATSTVAWITVTSGAAGTGNGSVGFSIAANTGAARNGTLTIANQTFTVTQAAGTVPCTYSIAPTSQNVDANANTGTVAVTAGAGCTWTATSGAPYITVTAGATGAGNGSVGFSVAANTGAARSGTLTIADQTFTVNQAAGTAPCAYSIAPTSQNVDANANTGTVAVTTSATCTWTATSGAPFITVTAGASGTGNGSVGFSVAANTGAARSGTLTIANQTFTVNQAAFVAPCTYSIAPTNQNVPALGGAGTVAVTTTAGCTWTAASNAPWLTITSGAAGAGNGSVGFSAAANVAGARSGTLTIAGQTFTVNQDAVVGPLNRVP